MIALLSTLCTMAMGIGPVSPPDSINHLHAAPGVTVQLIAAEPDVIDPVAVAFDEHGHMFVVENRGYPEDDSGAGRIALLTDTDGDGAYTRVSTFFEGLHFPNGVMPWKGGIIVTDAPQVLYLKDTTGDGVADLREVLLEGFSQGGSTQLRVSHPTLGLDNWIHFSNGLSGGDVRTAADTDPISMGLYDLRFNPFTNELQTEGGRAQFGLTFDDFGHKFVCSNRNHIQHVVISPHDLARNPALAFSKTAFDIPDHGAAANVFPLTGAPTTAYAHAGTFTAACGLRIYRGTSLPSEYHGNAFVCEPTGNLVHRDILDPDGATIVSRRGRADVEFLASEDDWFRPVFLTNGPNGDLYLCDMYRGTIEHPTYLPGEVAAVTDFDAGKDRGRIYRITGGKQGQTTFGATDTDALVARLSDDDGWSRDTAHRLLLERQDESTIPKLRSLFTSDGSIKARVHALNLLSGLGGLQEKDIIAALSDAAPALCEHGARLARRIDNPTNELAKVLAARSNDDDAHVRFETALALGDSPSHIKINPLATILGAAPDDEWTRAAVLSGVHDCMHAFAEHYLLRDDTAVSDFGAARAIGSMLARGIGETDVANLAARVVVRDVPDSAIWKIEFLNGMLSASRQAGSPETSPIDHLKGGQSPDTAVQLDALVDLASRWALDNDRAPHERISAIELLGFTAFDIASVPLAALLSPATPAQVQTEAIRSLFQRRDDRAAPLVLTEERWNAFTGQARDAALTGLLSTPNGAPQLLDALESGEAPLWTVPAQYRSRLLRHADTALQARAKAVFSEVPQEDRMEVYESHRAILELPGDSANGRTVFEKTCASCHRHGDLGHEVGPDLTGIGSQSSDSILLHILVPNWLKLPGYESYLVETDALEEFTGIIVAESEANITLRAAYGIESAIPRSSITSMKLMALSMMPGELEQTMTERELRDLIAFLRREPAN